MKSAQELYKERVNRIRTAVALGKPDRVPVVPLATSFSANHLGVKVADVANNPQLLTDVLIKSFTQLGEFDAIQQVTFSVHLLSVAWLSKVKIPGVDLPEDVPWQVAENELMTPEDYDTIINKGYNVFFGEFQARKLDNLLEKIQPFVAYLPEAINRFADIGVVALSPGAQAVIPYEIFCGGRTMPKFMRDLFKTPDKVQAAMDAAMPDLITALRDAYHGTGQVGAWVGGWRSASEFLSPKTWQRFVWPYMKQLTNVLLEEGVIPIFHLDSNWERDLEFFREMPKGRCIISPDSSTNIFKIKEVLGDHMCIMGDVPASLFTLGTTEDVYNYCTRLINEIGPSGFILSSGCDIPFNAKPENVAAMLSAVTGR